MVEVVNVVGSGQLSSELALEELAVRIGEKARYEPEMYPGLYLELEEDAPLATLYRTGKFNITGASSEEKLFEVRDRIVEFLSEFIPDIECVEFSPQNYVYSGGFDREFELNELAVGLGLERTEYEPEQFAGLLYHPNGFDSTIMIFRTGNVIVTGSNQEEDAKQAFEQLRNDISLLLNKPVEDESK